MKILLVSDNYESKSDGTSLTIRRLESFLLSQGHKVSVVSIDTTSPNHYALKERYIPLVTEISHKQKVRFAKFDRKTLEKALNGVDIVHLALPFQLERKVLKLCIEKNIAVTGAFHLHPQNILKNAGILKYFKLEKFIFWYWKKIYYDNLKHVHCPTEFAADEMKKHGYKSQVHVISNGIPDTFKFDDELSKEKPNDGYFRILMIGRFAQEKRQDLLIKAVMKSKHADKIRITFAGTGPRLKSYQEKASMLPNMPVFNFFNQEELRKEIMVSDLYVHAAEVEIEGMSCLEALACGLVPLIGDSKQSAANRFSISEHSIFKSGDETDLANKIDYFIDNPQVLTELSKAYIIHAENYRMPIVGSKMIQMFECAINDNNQKARG